MHVRHKLHTHSFIHVHTNTRTHTALPGPTPFTVQADTTSSLYVTWSTPPSPSSHPLLLRYEIITTHTVTNHAISTGTLPPHQMWWVMEGLNVSSEYRVNVVSWSPLGKGDEGQAQSAFTFGLGKTGRLISSSNVCCTCYIHVCIHVIGLHGGRVTCTCI